MVAGNLIGTNAAGTAALAGVYGIYLSGDNNTIGGTTAAARNVISGNTSDGININAAGNADNLIAGNYIGTNAAGTAAIANTGNGIAITSSSGDTIGGTAAGAHNVISGNSGNGVLLYSSGNLVAGNFIGTNAAGTAALGNGSDGIFINSAPSNTIGGTTAAARNIISGNGSPATFGISASRGVELDGAGATGDVIEGNYIGTDVTGTMALGNGGDGISLVTAGIGNTIGGTTAGAGNVIAGNGRVGIWVDAGSNDLIAANLIGTNAAGTAALGNGLPLSIPGIILTTGSTNDTVGGTTAAARNVISGNGSEGVDVQGNLNLVEGNYIGTNAAGTAALGNGTDGIDITGGASNNSIGGATASPGTGAGNVISGNSLNGVYIDAANNNTVLGNLIGTTADGSAALANGTTALIVGASGSLVGNAQGVEILSGNGNTIGGLAAVDRNVISGNTGDGVDLTGAGATGNLVAGNYIGTNVNGTAHVPNGSGGADGGNDGVLIANGATSNTIGGTSAGARNIISGNADSGVEITNSGTTGNVVAGNFIGTDATGEAGLGNLAGAGVAINIEATGNTIGGVVPGSGNVISGNAYEGVGIYDNGTTGNLVAGNFIGTDAQGTQSIGNGFLGSDGVLILWGASGNTIGGLVSSARNVISANHAGGVDISGSGATGNLIEGNYVGTTASGTAALGNASQGILIDGGASGNTIGGTALAQNVVSGNRSDGVLLTDANTTGNLIEGNAIGTDATGTLNLANHGAGILVTNQADNNSIGGPSSGQGNVIAFNTGAGVNVSGSPAPTGITIRGNQIYSNGGLGIDLGGNGTVVQNDSQGHSGPNNYLNFPVIQSFTPGVPTTVTGTFSSTPNGTFTLDFYANSTADPSGYGQAQIYLGSTTASTDGSGQASFSAMLSASTTPVEILTATATDAAGNTSEFSQDFTYTPGHVNPTVTVNGPTTGTVGRAVGLTSIVSDPTTGLTLSYAWSLTQSGNASFTLPAGTTSQPALSFTPPAIGSYVIQLTVTDSDGGSGQSAPFVLTVTAASPAVLIQGAPSVSMAGAAIALTNSVQDPVGAAISSYAWSVSRNGQPFTLPAGTVTNAAGFTFTPPIGGQYAVSLVVTDAVGGVGSASTAFEVNDVNLSTSIVGNPPKAPAGQPITLASTVDGTGITGTLSYTWTVIKDGNPFSTTTDTRGTFVFTPDTPATYSVSLTVSDSLGHTASATAVSIPVFGLTTPNAPAVTITNTPISAIERTPLTLDSLVSEPSGVTTTSYSWSVTLNGQPFSLQPGTTTGSSLTFTPSGGGLYAVTLNVQDSAANTGTSTTSFLVNAVTLTTSILGAPDTVSTGNAITLASTVIGSGVSGTLNYDWSVTRNGVSFGGANSSDGTFTFTPDTVGSYIVSLTVSDSQGHAGVADSVTITVVGFTNPAANPGVTITGTPAAGVTGTPITLGSMVSEPSGVTTTSYTWSVTVNGTPFAPGTSTTDAGFTFTPSSRGLYVVTLGAADSAGNTGSGSVSFEVASATPTAAILGAPAGSIEGQPITLSNAVSNQGLTGTLTYDWSVTKNGVNYPTPNNTASTFTFTPNDGGRYTIYLTVSDIQGDSDGATPITVPVALAVPPAVISGIPATGVAVGTQVSLTGTGDTPGTLDNNTLTWSVYSSAAGAVVATGSGSTFSFTPLIAGGDQVTLTATNPNPNGPVGSSTESLTVNPAPPITVALSQGTPTFQEHNTSTMIATVAGGVPGVAYGFSWTVTGQQTEYSVSGTGALQSPTNSDFSFIPPVPGDYLVSVTVTGSNLSSVSTSDVVTAVDVPPTVSILGLPDVDISKRTPVSLTAQASAPGGPGDIAGYQWGVIGPKSFDLTATTQALDFTPIAPGTYTVTLTATDIFGGTSSPDTETITVTPVPPVPTIVNLTNTNLASSTLTVQMNADIPPADQLDTLTYAWTATDQTTNMIVATGSQPSFQFSGPITDSYLVSLTVVDVTDTSPGFNDSAFATAPLFVATPNTTLVLVPSTSTANANQTQISANATQVFVAALAGSTVDASDLSIPVVEAAVGQGATLIGGSGMNILQGDSGSNLLEGGTGPNTLIATANDTLVGGSGTTNLFQLSAAPGQTVMANAPVAFNTLSFANLTSGITLNLTSYTGATTSFSGFDGSSDSLSLAGDFQSILGSAGNDMLFAPSNTTVYGGGGNDTLVANGGSNINLVAGGGNVQLIANNATNVQLFGGTGTDSLAASGDDDITLLGGTGDDNLSITNCANVSMSGGSGTATLSSSAGTSVTMFGGSGNDSLASSDDKYVSLIGGSGNASLTVKNGTSVTMFGGSGDDSLSSSGGTAVSMTGGTGNVTLTATGGTSVTLFGGSGNDSLASSDGKDVTLAGGTGNTSLTVKNSTSVTLFGGSGDDSLTSSGGTAVSMMGGTGNVTLTATGGTSVTMFGGSGSDSLASSDGSAVSMVAGDGSATLTASGGTSVTMFGGAGNDSLASSDSSDVSMIGGDGNATLSSSGGTSVTMFGGAGNDSLASSDGKDITITGGSGNATLSVKNGTSVTLFGGSGNDSLSSSGGTYVSMIGGTGNATLTSSGGTSVTMFGGSGNDSLASSDGKDITITGGSGNTTLTVKNSTSVTLFGGSGDDSLASSGGTYVSMTGGTGNVTLTSSGGTSVTMFGGTGNDSLASSDDSGVSMTGGLGDATLMSTGGTSVTMFGGSGNDSLASSDGKDVTMIGGTGNASLTVKNSTSVTLFGGSGNDSLASSGGTAVSMIGGTGNATLTSSGGASVTMFGGSGNDSLASSDGKDVSLVGGTGNTTLTDQNGTSVTLFGGSGNDSLASSDGKDVTMIGGTGNTTLTVKNSTSVTLFGGSGDDSLVSSGGTAVSMIGGTGNATLTSSGGTSVTMFGGSGNDSLASGDGKDVSLVGGTGNSTLTDKNSTSVTLFGGSGNDSLASSDGKDVTLTGGTGNATLTVRNGTSVTMFGGTGNDSLASNDGSDVSMLGGTGNDSLSSEGGTDVTLVGGTGNATLTSSGGTSVTMFGGTGNDSLASSDDSDISMIGGSGSDSLTVTGGTNVTVVGGSGNATLTSSGGTSVTMFGGSGNDSLASSDGSATSMIGGSGDATLTATGGTSVTMFGGSGNDSLASGDGSGVSMVGGTGDATLTATGGTSVTMFGGSGNDSLASGDGKDVTLVGGTGNSSLTVRNGTSVTLFGGSGNDSLASSDGSDISMVGGTGNATLTSSGGTSVTMFGGSGDDSLASSDGSDAILVGGTGNATLTSSSGTSVTMFGGTCTESLSRSGGTAVSMIGGTGNATLTATGGTSVTLFGGSGNDSLASSDGKDVSLVGGTGNSNLTVKNGTSVTLFGGSGNDSLTSSGGTSVTMVGGTGNATLTSSSGTSVTMFGGTGNDSLASSDGSDVSMLGGTGSDSLSSSGGNDVTMVGGTGNTTLTSSGGTSVTMFGGTGNDSLASSDDSNISLIGGSGNDSLTVTSGANVTVVGGSGNAILTSTGGTSVTLFGGSGNDSLASSGGTAISMIGGTGNATLTSSGGTSVTMFGGTGNDSLASSDGTDVSMTGDTGNATLTSSGGTSVTLFGGSGNDSLASSDGKNVTMIGGTGNATLTVKNSTSVTMFGGSGNDSLASSDGSDVSMLGGTGTARLWSSCGGSVKLFGGTGKDSLASTAVMDLILVGGTGNATVSTSGSTNFTVYGGTGNDSLVSTNDTTGSLIGGSGRDTLSSAGDDNVTLEGGGSGNDLFMTTGGTSVTAIGGAGNDTLSAIGGAAIALFGLNGDNTYSVSGTAASPISVTLDDLSTIGQNVALDDSQTLGINTITFPGVSGIHLDLSMASTGTAAGAMPQAVASGVTVTLVGLFQNVIGTPGDDWIKGDASSNVLTAGSGNDTLIGGTGPATLVAGSGNDSLVAGSGGTTFEFAGTQLGSQPGTDVIDPPASTGLNLLDFSQFGGPVTLNLGMTTPQTVSQGYSSLSVIIQDPTLLDSVVDSAYADNITGNSQGDTFYVGSGSDTFTGGGGSDSFFFSGSQFGNDVINETGTNNTLNFYGFGAAVNVNLSAGDQIVNLGSAGSLTVSNPVAFTRIVGSPYGGTIQGNNAPNETIIGGGGVDSLVAGSGNDYLQGYFTQVVYLDFPTAGQTPAGAHVYTAAEQQAILAGLQQIYDDFNYFFTLDPTTARQHAAVMGGQYATEIFDAPVVGGAASELDTKNLDLGGVAQINVTAFLGDASAGLVPATSQNIINLTTTIAAHELGHLSGLTHLDAIGPIGDGIFSGMNPNLFFPAYTGPENAFETPYDVMASPDSVGSTLMDAAGQTYLGERDAIQLAFNDTGTVLEQNNLPTQSTTVLGQTANVHVVGEMPALAVPNPLPAGVPGSGTTFNVTAVAVDGALQTAGAEDFYAIHGHAGEVMTFQVLSNYDTLNPDPILNPELAVFDSSGNTVAYNGNTTSLSAPFLSGAYNLHGFESQDPTLLDVTLPTDGTYYVGVDSFEKGSAGKYQLYMYSFGTTATPAGDTLIGGSGQDTLVGSSGNDLFTFTPNATGSATIIAGSGSDKVDLSFDPTEQVNAPGIPITPPLVIPTSLTASAFTVTYGQHGSVTMTVGGGIYTPTGSVSLSVDGGTAMTEPLTGGMALFDIGVLGAGSHSLTASYAVTGNFSASSAKATLSVNPATPVVTVTDASGTYNGSAFTATATVTGISASPASSLESATPVLTYYADGTLLPGAPTHAGTYTVVASFGGSADYTSASASATFTISPDSFSYTIGNDSQFYGTAASLVGDLPGSITTGVNNEYLKIAYSSTGDTTTAHVQIGGYPILGTLSSGTGLTSDYNVTLSAGTLTVNPYAFNYPIGGDSQTYGSAANLAADLPATIGTGVNGENLNIAYGSSGDVGTAQVQTNGYAITGTLSTGTGLLTDYNVTLLSGTLTVNQATPIITWATPQSITYGTALNGTQLDAASSWTVGTTTAAVAGMFSYSPVAGTVPGAGTHTLSVTFTPTDTTDYTTASQSVQLIVGKATPIITWATPQSITYGTPLSNNQLDAASSWTVGSTTGAVAGVFSYSPAGGTVLGAGTHTLSVTFAPGDTTDYTTATQSVVLAIGKAALTVTANNAMRVYGAGNPTFTVTITGFVNGDTSGVVSGSANLTTTATTTSTPGPYTITAGLGSLSAANYVFTTFVPGTLTVNPDSTTTTLTDTVSGQSPTFAVTVAANAPGSGTPMGTVTFVDSTTGQSLGTVTLSGGSGSLTVSTLPTGSQTVTATYNGDGNFLTSNGGVSVMPLASIDVLNKSTSGALTLSGNANITVPGTIDVDSSSSTAIVAGGNAIMNASSIQIVGGYSKSGNAQLNPRPTTGITVLADPLAGLAIPSLTGSKVTVNVSGNSSQTINPGIYSSISVSGNGKLTMNAGIYVIAGGGFSVSGNGSVTASGVLIYNAGSAYPILGGTFGGITFSGNGHIALSAPTTGTYAGIGLFQSRDNTQALSLSGNNLSNVTGSIYAANAQLVLSGNAQLKDALVVGSMNLSGNSIFNTLTSGGSGSGGDSGSGNDGSSGGNSGDAGPASAVVFTTLSSLIAAGGAPATIGVQLEDSAGNLAVAPAGGLTFNLSSSSATGTFLDLAGNATSTLTISAGESLAAFLYLDSSEGAPTLSVTATGFSATQQPVVTGAPAGVVFTSLPLTTTAGQSSQAITVQVVDDNGNPTLAGTGGATFTLSSTSNAGTFLDAAGQPISSITIPAGAGAASFSYIDGAIGMPTLTATAGTMAASQREMVNAGSVVYTPAQIRGAYGINNLPLDGTGQTIAIVDAYDDPVIFQALDLFDQQLGLTAAGASLYQQYGPASSFLSVLNENGQASPLPVTDPNGAGTDNWEAEEALDVEWTHAVAPGAHIILVEAASQSLPDLMTAVAAAAAQPGVSVVSMSWGFPESASGLASAEAQYDHYFTTPAGHQGVTFVASTGDYGSAVPEYPAFSPNVVAVGGTSLSLNADGSYNTETGWGYYANQLGTFIGSGGGVSQYESEPGYQQGVQSTGSRNFADVSFIADPATGAWIADPYNIPGSNPWEIAGGTSLSAPAWAGLIALVDQGRTTAGEKTLGAAGATETQTALYNLPQSDFNVIASGSNGAFTAQAGYNLVTGLGTPIANNLVTDLIAWSGTLNTSGDTVPAWQGSSSYQNSGSSGNGTDESIMAAMVFHEFDFESVGLGNANGPRSLASPDGGAATKAPADAMQSAPIGEPAGNARSATALPSFLASGPEGLRFESIAAATDATPAVAWVTAPVVPGAIASPARGASLSVFSQAGPLVLDHWSASPLAWMSVPSSINPQRDGQAATTPGLDGDDSVLVGGAGTDLVIGGAGRNLMVGGFGIDRGETSADATATVGEPGASATGDASALGDTAALRAAEAAGRDGVLCSALAQRFAKEYAETADVVILDKFFGSEDLDLGDVLEAE